jgi:3-hydroxymyristoyl/3-hydroxydecanoyl-(acyl carrier protein) dehydratase
MPMITREDVLARHMQWGQDHARQAGELHHHLLEMRQDGLTQLAGLIERQVRSYRPAAPMGEPARPLFALADLQEFASGDIVKCLGKEYAIYAGRRSPRIPNGDLLLMSRIISIQGKRGEFGRPSSIVAEYDVPAQAWYLTDENSGQPPYAVILEIALQPCGFLSAFLGTSLRYPQTDFFFRNLDGEAVFTRRVDVTGKTIQTHATLLETVFSGSTIIQHYAFELFCDGLVFYRGRSTFGYFPTQTMASQVGLDGGKPAATWLQDRSRQPSPISGSALEGTLPKGQLRLIDSVQMDPTGGKNQQGYVYASRVNAAGDWYYACHFYGDPVMPGSLGVEAILQAMQAYVSLQSGRPVRVELPVGQEMTWKYRGQVLQQHRRMQVEVHLAHSEMVGGTPLLRGDASLWADELRIYELRNVAISVRG